MRLLEKEQNRSFSLMVMFSIKNACANVKRFRNTTVCNSEFLRSGGSVNIKKKRLRLCHLLCLENS